MCIRDRLGGGQQQPGGPVAAPYGAAGASHGKALWVWEARYSPQQDAQSSGYSLGPFPVAAVTKSHRRVARTADICCPQFWRLEVRDLGVQRSSPGVPTRVSPPPPRLLANSSSWPETPFLPELKAPLCSESIWTFCACLPVSGPELFEWSMLYDTFSHLPGYENVSLSLLPLFFRVSLASLFTFP